MTTNSNIGSPVKVSVEVFYVEGQSQPELDKYVFAYSVTIKNHSLCNAKLLNRYWLITDANGREMEVEGEGVVGEVPTIGPGESYKYTSGAILDTPVGTMQGHYTLRNEFGTEFDAPIPVFRLACPNILH